MASKRLLTLEEIEDVLSIIRPSHLAVDDSNNEVTEQAVLNARESLRLQLVTVELYPEVLPKFKEEVKKQYYRSQMAPGEMVGVIAASSIGEQNTQASLNSFHSSGAFKANLTDGLARLNELMNATVNTKTPSLTIFMDPTVPNDLFTIRRLAFSRLIWVEVEDLVDTITISLDTSTLVLEPWYHLYSSLFDSNYQKGSYRIRLQLKVNKLWLHQIKLRKIVSKITSAIQCSDKLFFVYSHESIGILDIWVHKSIAPLTEILGLPDTNRIVLSVTNEMKIRQFIYKVVLSNILSLNLSGVTGLKECYYTELANEWQIDTKGGKLKEVIGLDCVNGLRCRSNDMHEVFELFGIEATKQMLRDEFGRLIKINPRHLELLIDSMTFSGSIQRVTRNGIDRKQVGTIAKASFEQPVDNFLISAAFGELDPLRGVSAAITVGKQARIGTGFMDLLVDYNKLKEFAEQIQTQQGSTEGIKLKDVQEADTGVYADQDKENEQLMEIIEYEPEPTVAAGKPNEVSNEPIEDSGMDVDLDLDFEL